MDALEQQRLDDIAAQVRRTDRRFADAMRDFRPCRPREYRNGRAWLALAVAVVVLASGTTRGDGMLIAAGLLLSAVATHLFDTHHAQHLSVEPPRR